MIKYKEISIPGNIEIEIRKKKIFIYGNSGCVRYGISNLLFIVLNNSILLISIDINVCKKYKALLSTMAVIVNNFIYGVMFEYRKKLILKGIGYKIKKTGNKLIIYARKSHSIVYDIPIDVRISIPSSMDILIQGVCKITVGQIAVNIRNKCIPDAYKGKGIYYSNEKRILKEVKKK